jgi:hypothetical protein
MPVRPRKDRRPDAWLLDFYVARKRYRLTVRAEGKRAAQALERQERERIESEYPQQRRTPTVGEAFARYWQEHDS